MKNLIIRSALALALLAAPAIALAPDFAANALRSATATITGALSAGTVATPTANIGTLRMVNGLSPLDLTYAPTPNPNAVMMGVGNRISFCPALSCVYGPYDGSTVPAFFDHQRASLLLAAQTSDDGNSQENTLAITTDVKTGYAPARQNNTAYAVKSNMTVGNAVYRATTGGTTGTTAPPGTRPAALPYNFTDGSVVWTWINDAAINAKVGAYIETRTLPGGGSSWGMANNTQLAPGMKPTFNVGAEFDFGNSSGTDCGFGNGDCYNLFVRSGGTNKSTGIVAIESEGGSPSNYAAYFGLRVTGPYTASNADIVTDSFGAVGIGVCSTGTDACTHSTAGFRENSTTPAGLLLSGHYVDGIKIAGTASGTQIAGNGFRVDPTGNTSMGNLSVSGQIYETAPFVPLASSDPCTVGQRSWNANFEFRCVATNSWRRAALSTW